MKTIKTREEALKVLERHGFNPGRDKTDPNGDPEKRAEIKAACNFLAAQGSFPGKAPRKALPKRAKK